MRTAAVNRAIDACLRTDFDAALQLTDSLIRVEPERPEGWFFRAAVLSIRMTDEESFRHEEAFHAALDSAAALIEPIARGKKEPAGMAFLRASIGSYRAYHLSRRQDWWPAMRHGLKAMKKLEALSEEHPDFEDVYLGLGNYYYWKSVKLLPLHWLPFLDDDREEGLRLVRRARENGQYNPWVAASNLSWMYLDNDQPDRAEKLCDEALAVFPGSRIFLFPLGDALIDQQRWLEAADVYELILSQLDDCEVDNGINRLICHEKLCRIHLRRGDSARAVVHGLMALDTPTPPELSFRVEKQRERLQSWFDEGGDPWGKE